MTHGESRPSSEASSRMHLSVPELPELAPLPVSTVAVILFGLVLWAVALVATLAVPALHEEDRSWWPWTCVAGLALGLAGLAYVRRGRGNAMAAGR
ncbi:conserved hypothetical protein [Nostocoides japonicum T1-X7]|uniref:Integral membrane protein n=1 Tax=Nostocoides japonicum T1-X7 TaxID=1194083 RepID=A0A077LYR6_9MICO|nr:DUF2530 domain-containing protein [Tetrasphaera japonica]CCH77120.1 conserved hypothetical protein [Tetrasphaera japonica T1-X7]